MDNNDKEKHPYDEGYCVERKTSDDRGSVALILGIIAIVCTFTGLFSIIGLILGIIAIVKGTSIRKYSSAGLAGWILGIISVSLFALLLILFFAFLFPVFLFPFCMF